MDPKEFMAKLQNLVMNAVTQANGRALQQIAEDLFQQWQTRHHQNPPPNGGKYAPVQVQRLDDDGNAILQPTTVPQLLAELCDHMMDIKDILEEQEDHRRSKRKRRSRRS